MHESGVARRWHGWTVGVSLAAAVALLATGCSGKTFPAKAEKPAVPAAKLAISPATGSQNVPTAGAINVTATGGKVQNVSVKNGGTTVAGDLSPDGLSWKSKWALHGAQTYEVTATAINSAGQTSTETSTFSTLKPGKFFDTEIGQASGKTYGVGMPIQLSFDRAITNRAAIEKALEVTTSQPVVGAWYWLDSRHLNFRPQNYWPANTTVTVRGHFNGVAGASNVYGKDISQSFKIGRSLIVVASVKTHRMQVYKDGKQIYNWKISGGRPGHDTPNGTYLTINKGNPVRMRPADVQKGEAGYYDLNVPWAVRITWSGIYLHDAYWSTGDQGYRNVSHGCLNMSPSNSKTYYQMEIPGDVVTVTGSPAPGVRGDGYTDWFLGWSDIMSQSATHMAVQAGPDGSKLVDPASLPADPGKSPITTSAPRNAKAS